MAAFEKLNELSILAPQHSQTQTAALPNPHISRRLDYIDALRGFACLWVLIHHAFLMDAPQPGLKHLPHAMLSYIGQIGWLGVNLFLVLSGFCLFYPYVRKNQVQDIHLNVGEFAKRRARRILPPYYIALAIFASLMLFPFGSAVLGHLAGLKDVLLHLVMLHNLLPSTIGSIDGPFWSLALECQLYLIFPLLVWLARKRGLRAILTVTLGVSLVWQALIYLRLGTNPTWSTGAVFYDALPGRCFEFAAGMSAAALVARPQIWQKKQALYIVFALLIPALVYVFSVGRFGLIINQVWGILFACAVVAASAIPTSKFERRSFLTAFVWLGGISYSVYLIHEPMYEFFTPQLFHAHTGAVSAIIKLVRLPVVILIGYLFFRVAEMPFMNRVPKLRWTLAKGSGS